MEHTYQHRNQHQTQRHCCRYLQVSAKGGAPGLVGVNQEREARKALTQATEIFFFVCSLY